MLSDQIGNFWWGGDEYGIGRLSDARPEIRSAKDSLSGRVRDAAAIRALTASLDAENPCVRRTAARMLGNSTVSDEALGRLFEHASPRVVEAALMAAGSDERPGLRTRMEGLLSSRTESTAAMAAWALGQLEMHESVDPLARALERGTPKVKLHAAWALGEIEDGRAVDPLSRVLRDDDARLRAVAVRALGYIEATSSAGDVERVLREDPDRTVRLEAIHALADIEAMSSLDALAAVLEGNDVEMAVAAAEAIDNLDLDGRAPAQLVRAASSREPMLRRAATMALANIADPATIETLIGLLGDSDPEIRLAAIEGLGDIGLPAATAGLTRALSDPDPEIRRAAVEALAEIEENEGN
jgi:HEAT repeat protein